LPGRPRRLPPRLKKSGRQCYQQSAPSAAARMHRLVPAPCHQPPTASPTHFLTWLVLAAPLSFFSAADLLQAAEASFSHFVMNDFSAATASFFCSAWALQVAVGACAPAAVAARATMAATARYLMTSLVQVAMRPT